MTGLSPKSPSLETRKDIFRTFWSASLAAFECDRALEYEKNLHVMLLFQKKVATGATIPVAPQKKLGPETDA